MTAAELIESVESMLDNAAAVGGDKAAEHLGRALQQLVHAADCRAMAIRARLGGRIPSAVAMERQSETRIENARRVYR